MRKFHLNSKVVLSIYILCIIFGSKICDAKINYNSQKSKWWEKLKGGVNGDEKQSNGDFTAEIEFLGHLKPEQQLQVLKQIGAEIQKSNDGKCNVFGGEESCMRLPRDSTFHSICPNHPLTVDCAYWSESLVEMDENPIQNLRNEMTQRGDKPCNSCLNNQQLMWCAQAVPKCGSFQKHVELALLPTLTQLATVSDNQDYYDYTGKGPASGAGLQLQRATILASAMPAIVQAMALSMPCRAMCQASVETCGCSVAHSFGDLITELETTNDPNEPLLPPGVSKAIFGSIWDTQLCDLYADEHAEGFTGYCDLTKPEYETCEWCSDEGMGAFTEVQLAGMLAEELYGWVAGPMGLNAESTEIEEESQNGELGEDLILDADTDQILASVQSAKSSSNKSAIVITVLVCLFAVGGAAVAGVIYYKKQALGFGMHYSAQTDYADEEYPQVVYEAPRVPLIDDEQEV
eukprot:CAMPEP_0196572558 /NCGR_PEP_ID=MMETSP1081-20130531/2590_1 /TAXON_ID=36882 /ORGANISM="Pyramimonas amylifera, Strain CCMP720" /LENGTH=460 /DNA_ID=CAMNT_0041889917 /DNA_START=38 /DNA_END=1420 /DNA_ORIENTATION=-